MNAVIYTIIFLLSAILTWVTIHFTLIFAQKKSLFDSTNSRKIHHGNVPRLGGVAFYISFIITIALVACYACVVPENLLLDFFIKDAKSLTFILCAGTLLFGFSLTDDLKGLRYRTKFIAQLVAGLLLCISGLWIKDLHGLFGMHQLSPATGWCITVFAVLLITNAINFIDGIDGLAGSLCSLSFIEFAVFGMLQGENLISIFSMASLSSILIFLYFNMKGKAEKKNKIFMGDTGSQFLGLLITAIGIKINNMTPEQIGVNPFVLAWASLIVPCFDVLRVVMLRLYKKKSPFLADKSHIHHLLLAAGHSQNTALLIITGISTILIASSLILTKFFNINFVFLLNVLLWIIIMMLIFRNNIKEI